MQNKPKNMDEYRKYMSELNKLYDNCDKRQILKGIYNYIYMENDEIKAFYNKENLDESKGPFRIIKCDENRNEIPMHEIGF